MRHFRAYPRCCTSVQAVLFPTVRCTLSRDEVSMRYAIVIEKVGPSYSAYVPDLPGCISTGGTLAEIETNIREAIAFHIAGMSEDGLPVPLPSSQVEYVDIAA